MHVEPLTRLAGHCEIQVLKEMRVKGQLMDWKEIKAAMGAKIVAPGLESAVAGTSLFVVGPEDSEEELKETVMEDMAVSGVWGAGFKVEWTGYRQSWWALRTAGSS